MQLEIPHQSITMLTMKRVLGMPLLIPPCSMSSLRPLALVGSSRPYVRPVWRSQLPWPPGHLIRPWHIPKNSKNAPERRVRRTEVYTCSKSLTNPRLCWRCWPKTKKSHPKGVEPSWHVRRRENLNKTRNQSNSRPQNGQNMRKHNEPKMAHFPISTIFHQNFGILESVVIDTFQQYKTHSTPRFVKKQYKIVTRNSRLPSF